MSISRTRIDNIVRTDPVTLIKRSCPQPNVEIIGIAIDTGVADDSPEWQIRRVYYLLGVEVTEFANKGKYNQKWSERATIFTPVASEDNGKADYDVNVIGGVTGEFSPSGLKIGGLVTVVNINNTTWTELPATALANRNAVGVQNDSGQEVKINYGSGVAGYVGMIVADGSERTYDITDSITLYAKSKTGPVSLNVEEIA